MNKSVAFILAVVMVFGLVAGCAQPTPQVIDRPVTVVVEKEVPVEKQVVNTVIVEKEKVVEKQVISTVVVEKQVEVEKPVTVVVEKAVQNPVKLVFWHPQQPDDFRGKLLDSMIQEFMKEYPWITIESVYQGNYTDLYKKIMAAISAGEWPQIAVSYPSMIAEYMKANAVIPLDSYIFSKDVGLSEEDMKDIFPGFLEECRIPSFGNQYLAWPFTKSFLGMYYNLTLLKEAGFSTPAKTWAEFEEHCNAVKAKTGKMGYAFYESASTFDGFLYSRGVRQLDPTETTAIFNGPEGIESLAMLNRMIEKGGAVKPEGNYADQAEFGKGNVAYTIASTSGTNYYKQAIEQGIGAGKIEWGQTNIPQADPNNPATVMYGGSMCVFRSTADQQLASWLFLKWLVGTKQTAKWASGSGYMPVRASAAAELKDFFAANPVVKEQFETIVPYGIPEPSVRGEQEIRTFIEEAWTASITGLMTPKEALDDAVKKANEALARGRE